MSFLPFFVWCNELAVSAAIRDSLWLFPVIQVFHLLSLGLLGGVVLLVDLRLLGLGLRSTPVAQLARDARPWMALSLVVITVSGVAMFVSEALRCYENAAFWVKMALFLTAVLYTYTVRAWWIRRAAVPDSMGGRVVAALSILLWAGVAAAGRGIGFW